MARKNPAAVALGRRGGRVNSEAQQQARRRNAQFAGRPSRYRLVSGELQRREGDRWLTLAEPYDLAARKYLSRHRALGRTAVP